MAELSSRLSHKGRDFRLSFEGLLQFGFRFFISETRNNEVRPVATMKLKVHEYTRRASCSVSE